MQPREFEFLTHWLTIGRTLATTSDEQLTHTPQYSTARHSTSHSTFYFQTKTNSFLFIFAFTLAKFPFLAR